jgi:hypothetical protein
MRSYIFTPKEKEVINGFLAGNVKPGDNIMRQLISRMKSFNSLASDVDLYIRLRKTAKTVST